MTGPPLPLEAPQRAVTTVAGHDVVMLACANHLGLDGDPRVTAAAQRAVGEYGIAVGGIPPLDTTIALHLELEAELASWLGTEAAFVCPTGAATDPRRAAALLGWARPVVVDSLDPRDADLPAVAEIARRCHARGARLVVDETRAVGVVGPAGRGVCALLGVADRVDLRTGTLGGALGAGGGFVAGPAGAVDMLRRHVRRSRTTAPVVPALAGAAVMAVRIARSAEGDERRERLRDNACRLRAALSDLGYPLVPLPRLPGGGSLPTPWVLIEVGDEATAMRLWERLYRDGVYVGVARHPEVRRGRARLRLGVMATHTDAHLRRVAERFAAARDLLAGRAPRRRLGRGRACQQTTGDGRSR